MARTPARKTPAKKAPAKRQGASRNTGKSQPARSSAPRWLWTVLGLLLGLFVAFLVHLWSLRKPAEPPVPVTTITEPQATPEKPARGKTDKPRDSAARQTGNSAPPAEEPRFDFYTLLPNQEVLPDKNTSTAAAQAAERARQQAARAQAQAEKEKTQKPGQPEAPAGNTTAYFLQAGSFKSQAEADKRRASILLLGLPVKIQTAPADGDTLWYRVVAGPFKGQEATQTARAALRANGIDSLPLKP